jgi:hypothetical protein
MRLGSSVVSFVIQITRVSSHTTFIRILQRMRCQTIIGRGEHVCLIIAVGAIKIR